MPQVDFMVVCDYVRTEGSIFHMIAAGIDRIRAPRLPTVQNVGVAARLMLTRAECEHEHEIQLIFQNTDGERVAELRARFRAEYPLEVPPGWPAYAALAFNFSLPLQEYGQYSFELLIGGELRKSIGVIVEPPVAGA